MNKVFLRGNVGKDPAITNFEGGGKVAQFPFATTEKGYTKRDGTKVDDITDWHNICVRKSGMAGIVEQYVKKGTPLLIVGKLRQREYMDSTGQRRFISEVVVEEMELLSGKKPEGAPAPTPEGYVPMSVEKPGDAPKPEKEEEDLPF